MHDTDSYLLRWKFTPPDFFEQPFEFFTGVCRVDVGSGEATMRAPTSAFPNMTAAQVCSLMHTELSARFVGAQIQSHTPYVLDRPSISILHADGTETAFAFAGIGHSPSNGSSD